MSVVLLLAAPMVVTSGGCEVATFANDARRKGIALYEQGNFTDAAGSFQNAVKQLPTDYRSFYWLGLTYEKLDQNQRAIQAFKAARDTRLETMEGTRDLEMQENIYNALARSIAASASRDDEIEILKIRSATARNGDDLIVLARVFRESGDPDSAVSTYQQAVDRYPRNQDYAVEFGKYLTTVGLKDRARQVLSAAAKVRPNSDVQAALKAAEAN
jgi:Tfp pilus assembly protein PilF